MEDSEGYDAVTLMPSAAMADEWENWLSNEKQLKRIENARNNVQFKKLVCVLINLKFVRSKTGLPNATGYQ